MIHFGSIRKDKISTQKESPMNANKCLGFVIMGVILSQVPFASEFVPCSGSCTYALITDQGRPAGSCGGPCAKNAKYTHTHRCAEHA